MNRTHTRAGMALLALAAAAGFAMPASQAHAGGSFCNARSVCLYADANQRGTKRTYTCRWNQHGQVAFDLRRQFPPGTLAGVSSWHATTTGDLSTIPPRHNGPVTGVGVTVTRGLHNVVRWFNDRAPYLYVDC
jgi:hypothetical protein